mmetsp:Transcript_58404/g.126855  ORF Transcript_58404/g.126855 Transcript_58404/m.126855 type:complete len:218 (-) Transcript_58404:496-1149(-)
MLRGQRGLRLQKGVDLLLEAEVRPKLQIRQRQVGHRRGLVRFEPALDRGALVGEVVVSAHGVKHEVLGDRAQEGVRNRLLARVLDSLLFSRDLALLCDHPLVHLTELLHGLDDAPHHALLPRRNVVLQGEGRACSKDDLELPILQRDLHIDLVALEGRLDDAVVLLCVWTPHVVAQVQEAVAMLLLGSTTPLPDDDRLVCSCRATCNQVVATPSLQF